MLFPRFWQGLEVAAMVSEADQTTSETRRTGSGSAAPAQSHGRRLRIFRSDARHFEMIFVEYVELHLGQHPEIDLRVDSRTD